MTYNSEIVDMLLIIIGLYQCRYVIVDMSLNILRHCMGGVWFQFMGGGGLNK